MKTEMVVFDSVPLIVPVVNGNPIEFPDDTFEMFPSYCGAGRGIGDTIIPETVLFLPISPACYLHDRMWELAEPTWQDFHATNNMFRSNIDSIIRHKSTYRIVEHLRYYRSVTFFVAVNTIGTCIFWKLKKEQGYEGDDGETAVYLGKL